MIELNQIQVEMDREEKYLENYEKVQEYRKELKYEGKKLIPLHHSNLNKKQIIELQEKIVEKNEPLRTNILQEQHEIQLERYKARIQKNQSLDKQWKEIQDQKEKEKLQQYQKVQKKHQDLLQYLRERQKALEKEKPGILSQQSYLKYNDNIQKLLEEKDKRKNEILQERQPMD